MVCVTQGSTQSVRRAFFASTGFFLSRSTHRLPPVAPRPSTFTDAVLTLTPGLAGLSLEAPPLPLLRLLVGSLVPL